MTPQLSRSSVGIGLRAPHYREVLASRPALDFLEVHSENFFHAGGASMAVLEAARSHYPISLHGVGLSLASADHLRNTHLERLAALVERIEPALVSEHLCWGAVDQYHTADLIPFPSTHAALNLVCERVDYLQEYLGRRVLIENISAYVRFKDSEMSEFELLAALAKRSGCGILLDINNLYVNAQNFGFDAMQELHRLPTGTVGEIHLAGHSVSELCLIDTHSTPVCDGVWALYAAALEHTGPAPTLIERDADIPPLHDLLAEAEHAREHLAQHCEAAYA